MFKENHPFQAPSLGVETSNENSETNDLSFNHFEIVEECGTGADGSVSLALWKKENKPSNVPEQVVIKSVVKSKEKPRYRLNLYDEGCSRIPGHEI